MSEAYSITNGEAGTIGLRFENGHWYRYSTAIHGWGMVEDKAAVHAAQRIAELLSTVPFALPLSAVLNLGQGSDHVH